MKTAQEIDRLVSEAGRKLEAAVRTGLAGLKQQGIDRMRALGILVLDSDDAAFLVEFLRTNWSYRG